MLVRLTVANFLSVAEERSFDMLPNDRITKLGHHKIAAAGIEVLKLGALYGANAGDTDKAFKTFAREVLSTYDLGISDIVVETTSSLEEFYGKDDIAEVRKTVNELELKQNRSLSRRTENGDEISIVMSEEGPVVKRVQLMHVSGSKTEKFYVGEESDGTKRLIDFLPAFYQLTYTDNVFVIDEIESSIHPLLIYELIEKFSHDENKTGQLILTTHESNLLDQDCTPARGHGKSSCSGRHPGG